MHPYTFRPKFIDEKFYSTIYVVNIAGIKRTTDIWIGDYQNGSHKKFYEVDLLNPAKGEQCIINQTHLPAGYPQPYSIPVYGRFSQKPEDGLRIDHVYIKPIIGQVPYHVSIERNLHDRNQSICRMHMRPPMAVKDAGYLKYSYYDQDNPVLIDTWRKYYDAKESGIFILLEKDEPSAFEVIIGFSELPEKKRTWATINA